MRQLYSYLQLEDRIHLPAYLALNPDQFAYRSPPNSSKHRPMILTWSMRLLVTTDLDIR